MTTDELDQLPLGTPIYLATEWEVQTWIFAGTVNGRSFYTFTHPADADGVIHNRRPVYLAATDLLNARINEKQAWALVKTGLLERTLWVDNKLTSYEDANHG